MVESLTAACLKTTEALVDKSLETLKQHIENDDVKKAKATYIALLKLFQDQEQSHHNASLIEGKASSKFPRTLLKEKIFSLYEDLDKKQKGLLVETMSATKPKMWTTDPFMGVEKYGSHQGVQDIIEQMSFIVKTMDSKSFALEPTVEKRAEFLHSKFQQLLSKDIMPKFLTIEPEETKFADYTESLEDRQPTLKDKMRKTTDEMFFGSDVRTMQAMAKQLEDPLNGIERDMSYMTGMIAFAEHLTIDHFKELVEKMDQIDALKEKKPAKALAKDILTVITDFFKSLYVNVMGNDMERTFNQVRKEIQSEYRKQVMKNIKGDLSVDEIIEGTLDKTGRSEVVAKTR